MTRDHSDNSSYLFLVTIVAESCARRDWSSVSHRFTEEDMSIIQSPGIDDLKYEFEDELKEIFGEE